MSRLAVFVILTIAAYAQANIERDAVKIALLRENRLPIYEKANLVQSSVKESVLCKECEKVVSTLKKVLDNPDTEQQLLNLLKSVCDSPLVSAFKERCLNMVNTVEVVIHELQGLLDDPTAVCQSIQFCDQSSASSINKRLILAFAAKIVQDIHEPSPIFKVDTCSLCTSAVDEVKKVFENVDLMTKVQTELQQLCKYAGKFESDCSDAVLLVFPQIVQKALDALADPTAVCQTINLCEPEQQSSISLIKKRLNLAKPIFKVDPSLPCFVCKKEITRVKEIFEDEALMTKVEDTLLQFCQYVGPLQPNCTDAIETYFPQLVQQALDALSDPEQVCTVMGLCNNSTSVDNFEIMQSVQNIQELSKLDPCAVCTKVLNIVKKILENEGLMTKVEDRLLQLCQYTEVFQENCTHAVETYFPQLVQQALDALADPEHVCALMNLCNGTTVDIFGKIKDRFMSVRQHFRASRLLTKINMIQTARGIDVGCLACEVAVDAALRTLNQPKVMNSTATEITNMVCNLLPKDMRPSCFDFLEIYGVAALQFSLGELTPQQVCQEMHACPAKYSQQMEIMSTSNKSVIICDSCKVASRVLAYELQQPSVQQDIINIFLNICNLVPGGQSQQCDDWVIQYVPDGLSYVADFFTRADACAVLQVC